MTSISEVIQYDQEVYLIEPLDLVLGGPSGPSNQAAINLANRTAYLRQLSQAKALVDSTFYRGIDLDFRTGQISSLPSGFSFSRNSVAWTYKDTGRYELTRPNQIALSFDEESNQWFYSANSAATNVVRYSSDVANAAWTISDASISTSSINSVIDGQAHGTKLTSLNNVNAKATSQVFSEITNGTPYTCYVIIERDSSDIVEFGVSSISTFSGYARFSFLTESMTVFTGVSPGFIKKISEKGPNGGKVFLVGFESVSNSSSQTIQIFPHQASSAVPGESVIIHHVQVTGTSQVVDPIVTTNAVGTRESDSLTFNFSGFGSGFSAITSFKDPVYLPSGRESSPVVSFKGNSADGFSIGRYGNTTQPYYVSTQTGASYSRTSPGGYLSAEMRKVAISFSPGDLTTKIAQDGSVSFSGSALGISQSSPVALKVGGWATTAPASSSLASNRIYRVTVIPNIMSELELIGATTSSINAIQSYNHDFYGTLHSSYLPRSLDFNFASANPEASFYVPLDQVLGSPVALLSSYMLNTDGEYSPIVLGQSFGSSSNETGILISYNPAADRYAFPCINDESNHIRKSSTFDALWVDTSSPAKVSVPSIFSDLFAMRITSDGNSAHGIRNTSLNTLPSSGIGTYFGIYETQGSTPGSVTIAIQNITTSTTQYAATFDLVSGASSSVTGDVVSVISHKLMDVGPNGGMVWQFGFVVNYSAGTSGNSQSYSTWVPSVSGTQVVQHHAQAIAGKTSSGFPVVNNSSSTVATLGNYQSVIGAFASRIRLHKAFTLYAEVMPTFSYEVPGTFFEIMSIGTQGTSIDYISLGIDSNMRPAALGTDLATIPTPFDPLKVDRLYKIALSYSKGYVTISVNGQNYTSPIVIRQPNSFDIFDIGPVSNLGFPGDAFRFTLIPQALNDLQLRELTLKGIF